MISFEWFKIERRENLKEINNAIIGEVIPILAEDTKESFPLAGRRNGGTN
jgi:hypothetical protein